MSIKKDLASGIFYTSIAKYSGIIIQLVITAVLARLLTPSDFGVVAVATVIIQFFNTLSEAGIGASIIQKKELSKTEIESIFTATILIGVVLGIIFFWLSTPIANYYHDESLINICRWLSFLVLFSSADVVLTGLLLKKKAFKAIAIRTLSVQIFTGGVSIIAAFKGMGMYALVLSSVSSKILVFIINYILNPLELKVGFVGLHKIWNYSVYQFLFNIMNYFSRNADKLIIGKYMGMGQLGYYEKSYRLMMLPLSNLTYILTPVLHPVFSEYQNEKEKLIDNYLKMLKILGLLSVPMMIFLFFNAKELILIFFGNQWMESVLPFKILSLTTALQVLHSTASGIFQASDNTKGLFLVSFVSGVLLVGGFLVSSILFDTIVAVAYSFLITCTIGSLYIFYYLLHSLKKPFYLFFKTIKDSILLAIIEFVVLFFITLNLPYFSPIYNLIVNSIAIVLIWFGYIKITKVVDITYLVREIRKK